MRPSEGERRSVTTRSRVSQLLFVIVCRLIELYSYIDKKSMLSYFGQRKNTDVGARVRRSHSTV